MFGKVLGILALIVAGISCVFPGGALIATFVGAPLIVFSWKKGAIFGYIAGGLNIVNIIFLSPTVWIAMGTAEAMNEGGALSLGVIYVAVQVTAMVIMGFITWKSNKNNKSKSKSKTKK
tara:strand:+ start:945 stop:1301 length:357 start_codon:yes stop_codon:yes gene_type:complete